jgi:hypothetical protein
VVGFLNSGARAAADGYNLVVGIWNTHVAGATDVLQYDVAKDFTGCRQTQ